jgi:hypothetical protein
LKGEENRKKSGGGMGSVGRLNEIEPGFEEATSVGEKFGGRREGGEAGDGKGEK